MNTLLHLPYSPWSERARWALDAQKVDYRPRTFQPLLGEPQLRVALKRWRGRVSVPVLFTPDGPIVDSFAIARFADTHGAAPARLFPDGKLERIAGYNEASERALRAGRVLMLLQLRDNEAALRELVPRRLRWLGPGLARFGAERTRRKYGADQVSVEDGRETLGAVLRELRRDLGAAPAPRDGPRTLLGQFSYADVTMAQTLAFVTPPARAYLRIGEANRRCFTDDALASEFADLVAWRDALYDRYRRPAA